MTRKTLLLASVLLLSVGPAFAQDVREEIPLNGEWESCITSEALKSPPADGWNTQEIPGVFWSLANGGSKWVWCRKQVPIPRSWRGNRVFLKLWGARYQPTVFVRGKQVATRLEGWTPFEVELTEWARPGENLEVVVRCQDWSANFRKGFRLPLQGDPKSSAADNVLAPSGGHSGFYGLWDDVTLHVRPPRYTDDVAIVPSFREHKLTVTGGVDGDSSGLLVEGTVLDGDQAVLTLPAAPAARKGGRFTLTAAFPKARCWSPEDPHLYSLQLTLKDKDGAVLDRSAERFGFRELWAEGSDLMLNGVKRHMLASSNWPTGGPQTRETVRDILLKIKHGNMNAYRLHTQPWARKWLDLADEVGVMIVEEGALWCDTPGMYAYRDPKFWENYREHLKGMVARDRNHACLVMWSMENEILHCGALSKDPDTERKLAESGRYVKTLDPTHLITFEADLDPGGAADVIGLHYPHEMPENADYPDTAYWMNKPITTGIGGGLMGSRGGEFQWDKKKPLYIGEYLWVPFRDYSPGTVFFGDLAYEDHDGYNLKAKGESWKYQTVVYRWEDVSGLCPWTAMSMGDENDAYHDYLYEIQKKLYEPLAAFPAEYDTRFFAGAAASRIVYVFNDQAKTKDLGLRWSFGAQTGLVPMKLAPGGRQAVTLKLTMPPASSPKVVKLEISLTAGRRTVYGITQDFTVSPKNPLRMPTGVQLLLFDPKGSFSAKLPKGSFRTIPALKALADADPSRSVLVVGPGAFGETDTRGLVVIGRRLSDVKALVAFLADGGRALLLEQATYAGLPLNVSLTEHASTLTFPVMENHPVLQGLSAADFRFWNGDHYVTRREVLRPQAGGARPLLVSGGVQSVAQSPLMEMPCGRGCVLLVQALVGEKLGTEPAARRLLENALAYLARYTPHSGKTLAFSDDEAFLKRLKDVGLAFGKAPKNLKTADLQDCRLLVLDGASPNTGRALNAVRDSLKADKDLTVFWHAPEGKDIQAAKAWMGCDLDVGFRQSPLQVKDAGHPVLSGVLREDLAFASPRGPSWDRAFDLDPGVVDRLFLPPGGAGEKAAITATDLKFEGGVVKLNPNRRKIDFYTNGRAWTTAKLGAAGLRRGFLTASGTPAGGVYPVVQVTCDGRPVAVVSLDSSESKTYEFLADFPAGAFELALSYGNDAQEGGQDRNLFLESVEIERRAITIPGADVLTAPPALMALKPGLGRLVLSSIRWDTNAHNRVKADRFASALFANLGGEFEPPGSQPEWIGSDVLEPVGTIPYFSKNAAEATLVAAGALEARFVCAEEGDYRVFVRGRSQPAKGVYSKVRVKVDGKSLPDVEVASTSHASFEAGTLHLTAGEHHLLADYINDFYSKTEDRNLYLGGVGFLRKP